MDFDFVIFDKDRRFRSYATFSDWCFDIVDYCERNDDSDDYHTANPELQHWFLIMKDLYVPLTGAYALEALNDYADRSCANYYFTDEAILLKINKETDVIIHEILKQKTKELNLAFFDTSCDAVVYPDGFFLNGPEWWEKEDYITEVGASIANNTINNLKKEQRYLYVEQAIIVSICCILGIGFAIFTRYLLLSWFSVLVGLFEAVIMEINIRKKKKKIKVFKEKQFNYVSDTPASFAFINKNTFSDDVLKHLYDNACVAFYENLSNHWFYVHYHEGWPECFIVNSFDGYVTLDKADFPEYQLVNDLVYAVDSKNIEMIGTISMSDYKIIKTASKDSTTEMLAIRESLGFKIQDDQIGGRSEPEKM